MKGTEMPNRRRADVPGGSSFFWLFTDSPLRRKGRMTGAQKRKRVELETQLGRPDPGAVEKDVLLIRHSALPRRWAEYYE